MTCKQLVDFLDQYLADELPRPVREDFEAHLAGCASCERYLASYRKTIGLAAIAAKHPDDAPPADVPEELVRAVLSARRSQRH